MDRFGTNKPISGETPFYWNYVQPLLMFRRSIYPTASLCNKCISLIAVTEPDYLGPGRRAW